MEVANEELEGLYAWVDEIPLSRLKRSLSRDFADGGAAYLLVLLLQVAAGGFVHSCLTGVATWQLSCGLPRHAVIFCVPKP